MNAAPPRSLHIYINRADVEHVEKKGRKKKETRTTCHDRFHKECEEHWMAQSRCEVAGTSLADAARFSGRRGGNISPNSGRGVREREPSMHV